MSGPLIDSTNNRKYFQLLVKLIGKLTMAFSTKANNGAYKYKCTYANIQL